MNKPEAPGSPPPVPGTPDRRASLQEWLDALQSAFSDGTLVGLSLGHYKGHEDGLQGIQARPVVIRGTRKLSFTYRYRTRDIIKNADNAESVQRVAQALADGFRSGRLLTTGFDLAYERQAGGRDRLRRDRPTRQSVTLEHDRRKKRLISTAGQTYLQALGITAADGTVRQGAQGKYRQINRYVELLAPMLTPAMKTVADMGAGKGYLTFALYDYMTSAGMTPRVTGVEQRADLVSLCNRVAARSGFAGLQFQEGTIRAFDTTGVNLLVALHACDTATDDALAKGVDAGADLIVVAPCCHRQIRHEMEAAGQTSRDFLLRHGVFLERQAEMVTDGLRALILEAAGYATRVFEFISDAHTARNIMITARKRSPTGTVDPAVRDRIREAKARFGIRTHYLETVLRHDPAAPPR